MRLALGDVTELTDEILAFGAQVGATDVIVNQEAVPSEKGYYDYLDLLHMRTKIEDAGLKLFAIENIAPKYCDKILAGLPGRDEQIENWCKSLTNMGKAGIPVLGYHFMVLSVWRTSFTTPGRGGARVTSFDYELVKDAPLTELGEISDEQMWDNFTYFIKAVIPVAEKVGVKMCLHPDDPPVSPIAGIARIFRSHEDLVRLTELVPSDYNGIEFCQGTISEMPEDVLDAIRYFGSRNKIGFVHFRNVSGPVPTFDETFIDEGHVDMLEAMKLYKEVGFDGPMMDDHVPQMIGEPGHFSGYGYRSRAYALGYMRAFMEAVEAMG